MMTAGHHRCSTQGVRPGKARMYHCLLVNAQQPDFSTQCRGVLIKQVHRRTRDWRLDFGLMKFCGGDVPRVGAGRPLPGLWVVGVFRWLTHGGVMGHARCCWAPGGWHWYIGAACDV